MVNTDDEASDMPNVEGTRVQDTSPVRVMSKPEFVLCAAVDVKPDAYSGPLAQSNWVVPDKLLVGAYPAGESDAETTNILTTLLRSGVTTFVSLSGDKEGYSLDANM